MIVPLEKPGTPEELVHFGVKGMKWGVRKKEETSDRKSSNFKPGPVRQKLIKYHTNVARGQQDRIDYLNAHPSTNFFKKRNIEKEIKQREKYRDQHLKDIKDLKEGHLTDFQKHALIGAGIAVVVLGAYGAYKLHDSRARQYIQAGDKIIGVPFKRNDLLSRKMTSQQIMDEVIPQINPGSGKGRRNNCLRCSFAYELRRRGFDVEAKSTRQGMYQTPWDMISALGGDRKRSITDFQSLLGEHSIDFTDLASKVPKSSNALEDWSNYGSLKASKVLETLSKHEEGARGELGVSWILGGAHSMSWEVIGGRAHIFDTQTRQHYKTPEEFLKLAKNASEVAYTRLDNIDLDEDFIRTWVHNVK